MQETNLYRKLRARVNLYFDMRTLCQAYPCADVCKDGTLVFDITSTQEFKTNNYDYGFHQFQSFVNSYTSTLYEQTYDVEGASNRNDLDELVIERLLLKVLAVVPNMSESINIYLFLI